MVRVEFTARLLLGHIARSSRRGRRGRRGCVQRAADAHRKAGIDRLVQVIRTCDLGLERLWSEN